LIRGHRARRGPRPDDRRGPLPPDQRLLRRHDRRTGVPGHRRVRADEPGRGPLDREGRSVPARRRRRILTESSGRRPHTRLPATVDCTGGPAPAGARTQTGRRRGPLPPHRRETMIALTPTQAAELPGGVYDRDPQVDDPTLTGAGIDPRKVTAGALFVALPGERVNGHDYVAAARAAGAAAALVSRHVPGGGPQIVVPDPAAALGILARHHLARLRERAAAAGRPLHVIGITG